ncbi:hypothetical protein [Jeotgalicoccus meleagridis]|uniref:hypothetical protein n=1 Tax=Jeotgalicoccus meleagridis TaxID=2759181 RepID=UPI001618888D|nr:hypothetical protein [Jeotgalicoccus meleagridis]
MTICQRLIPIKTDFFKKLLEAHKANAKRDIELSHESLDKFSNHGEFDPGSG